MLPVVLRGRIHADEFTAPAEFLARFPEQIFLKRRLRLREESFSPDVKFQQGFTNRAGNFNPVKRAEKLHVIGFKFQPGLKYQIGHAHRLNCECKTHSCKFSRSNFKHSSRAEIKFAT